MRLFPFSAIVGQEALKTALILNAINPAIGGVLIRGEKGTAKSTLARALAELLPEIDVMDGCPFSCAPDAVMAGCPHCCGAQQARPVRRPMRVVSLPANATEDRVAGTLDMEYALKHGSRRFEPGVLAAAHRGILYIDEVNLLDDHIVDLLLDAAAMGVNTVEREGMSFSHPARFVLIGTMNPEEGDLRPQLLDRFALCVDAEALMDVRRRAQIVRRCLDWEQNPEQCARLFARRQTGLAGRIDAARRRLTRVTISPRLLDLAARLCIELDVRSHRADIVIARAACTLAAFEGRLRARRDDIRRCALMALSHRMRRRPFEESRLDPEKIDRALQAAGEAEQGAGRAQSAPGAESEQRFEIGDAAGIDVPERDFAKDRAAAGTGRRSRLRPESPRGRVSRSEAPSGSFKFSDVALDATLRAAAADAHSAPQEIAACVRPEHIRIKRRTRAAGTTVLLLVDASGSMAADRRMSAAKGAALALLQDAYVKRNRVSLLAFRNDRAEVLLEPTDNVELAHERLKDLPTGGRTPLAHGLAAALEQAHQVRRRDPDADVLCVLISDGRANVPYAQQNGQEISPFDEALAFARQLHSERVRLIVLDTEDEFLSLGLAKKLARQGGADYVRLACMEADVITDAVRERLPEGG